MDAQINAIELSAEQRDTVALLDRLFGSAIADRYTDFCRIVSGTLPIKVSLPVASHILRELESTLRGILEVPMQAQASVPNDLTEKMERARKAIRSLGFDNNTSDKAVEQLKPQFSHKDQIKTIVSRLGFDASGDIARLWISLTENVKRVHRRSFHHVLAVDSEFREQFQRPFDTVIRAVAIALEGRYVAMTQRVEALAAMADRDKASKMFASEIPGALPLQWHFFERLTTGDWLPHLEARGLLAEPLPNAEVSIHQHRQWPAGIYLLQMAKSPDDATRQGVARAMRAVANSRHPDVCRLAFDILAALPAAEAAPLVDLAIGWLDSDVRLSPLAGADAVMQRLAEGNQPAAALKFGKAVLQLRNEGGQIVTRYDHSMYEYRLPTLEETLTKACREDALYVFVDLLKQAIEITRRTGFHYYSSCPVTDDSSANVDTCQALVRAVRCSAEFLIAECPDRMREIVGIVEAARERVFIRLTLYLLSRRPSSVPDLAAKYLLDAEMIDANWCQQEYGHLARDWFPSLGNEQQAEILKIVDEIPGKYLDPWRERFSQRCEGFPTADQEREFVEVTIMEIVWYWREALPLDRQKAVAETASAYGDLEERRAGFFQVDGDAISTDDFISKSVPEIANFVKAFRTGEPQRDTITGVAHALRMSVANNPERFAAQAEEFCGAKPTYIRHVLDALHTANGGKPRPYNWPTVLRLVEWTLGQAGHVVASDELGEGDDPNWDWACLEACKLLGSGLQYGKDGIPFEHASSVVSLVAEAAVAGGKIRLADDFEEQYEREPFFAAQGTVAGQAVGLQMLLLFWLVSDTKSAAGAAPRDALRNVPEVREALEAYLADHSGMGRVCRAMLGRYLTYLFYYGEDWLQSQASGLFPVGNSALRHATWSGHLAHDRGPLPSLIPFTESLMLENLEIISSGEPLSGSQLDEYCRRRLVEFIIVLYLGNALPENILEEFWRTAPSELRNHALWFIGKAISRSPEEVSEEEMKRGMAYWERRLAAANSTGDKAPYRDEFAAGGSWCLHNKVAPRWMCDQLLAMSNAGFGLRGAFTVFEWLPKIAPFHPDQAVSTLLAIVKNGESNTMVYTAMPNPISIVLMEGLANGTAHTGFNVQEIVSTLASRGDRLYLGLIRNAE